MLPLANLLMLAAIVLAVHPLPAQSGSIEGTVYDSVRGAPLAGAMVIVEGTPNAVRADGGGRYRLDSVPAGALVIAVESEALDSLGVAVEPVKLELREGELRVLALATPSPGTLLRLVCAGAGLAEGEGEVSGVVRVARTRAPVSGATVEMSWDVWVLRGTKLEQVRTGLVARSGAQGMFTGCGVPLGALVTIRVNAGEGAQGEAEVRIAAAGIARQDVSIGAPGDGGAPVARTRDAGAGAASRPHTSAAGGVRLDRVQVERAGSVSVPELLRSIAGFRVVMGSRGATAVWTRQRRDCAPVYYLDGQPVEEANTGRSTDVEELETYSPGQAPPRYGGASATCAVVLIWSRRTPAETPPERSAPEGAFTPP